MKGFSPLIDYTILVGVGLVLIIAVSSTMTSLTNQFKTTTGSDAASQVCLTVKSAIEKGFSEPSYQSFTNTTLSSITLSLPPKIGDASYVIRFSQKNISISTLTETINATCKIGFNAAYEGSSGGGKTLVTVKQLTNGTMLIGLSQS